MPSDPARPAQDQSAPEPRPRGSIRIGRFAGADILVSSSWFVVAAVIAWLFAPLVERAQPGLGNLRYAVGFLFAVVLYGSVLLHELSHAVMARRMGFGITSITLHFLGGATQVKGESKTPRQEFWIAVVGPITSLVVGVAALGVWWILPDGLVRALVQALAGANLLVGVTNLFPALPLDGGRVLKAGVWHVTGNMYRGTIVAAWGGRVLAGLVLLWPVFQSQVLNLPTSTVTWLTVMIMGLFLWTTATAFLNQARVRERLPTLFARPLVRHCVFVDQTLPLSEAIRLARTDDAGSIVAVDATGAPVGIVVEAAVLATPEVRRAWVPVSSVTRSVDPGLVLPAELGGEELIMAMSRRPAQEYLVAEVDGTLVGVLSTADVDRAFRGSGH